MVLPTSVGFLVFSLVQWPSRSATLTLTQSCVPKPVGTKLLSSPPPRRPADGPMFTISVVPFCFSLAPPATFPADFSFHSEDQLRRILERLLLTSTSDTSAPFQWALALLLIPRDLPLDCTFTSTPHPPFASVSTQIF